jgi:hypothetical protein
MIALFSLSRCALILALASLALTFPLQLSAADPKSGTVTVSVGDVKVKPAGAAAAKALSVDDTVVTGSTISTGPGSRAVVVMTATSAIRVAENSEVLITEIKESAATPKVLVDLKSGALAALLNKEPGIAMDFQIKTPSGIAAARGTYFAVVVENGKGFAQVKEGVVEIVPKDAAAGQ